MQPASGYINSDKSIAWFSNNTAPNFARIDYTISPAKDYIQSTDTGSLQVSWELGVTAQCDTGNTPTCFYGRDWGKGSILDIAINADGAEVSSFPIRVINTVWAYSVGVGYPLVEGNPVSHHYDFEISNFFTNEHWSATSKQSLGLHFTGRFCFGAEAGSFGQNGWTSSNPYPGSTIDKEVNTYLLPLTYDLAGGTWGVPGQSTPPRVLVVNGGTYTIPASTPTKTGYTFMGWQRNSTTTTYNAGDSIESIISIIKLTALWQPTDFENVSSVSINKNTVTSTNELPSTGLASTSFTLSWECNAQNVRYYDIAFKVLYGTDSNGNEIWSGLYWYGKTDNASTKSKSVKLTDANLKVQSSYNHQIDPSDPANIGQTNYDTIDLSKYEWKSIRFYVRSVGISGTQGTYMKPYVAFTELSLILADISDIVVASPFMQVSKSNGTYISSKTIELVYATYSNIQVKDIRVRFYKNGTWVEGQSSTMGICYPTLYTEGLSLYTMIAVHTEKRFDVTTNGITYSNLTGYCQSRGDVVFQAGPAHPISIESPWRFYPRPENSYLYNDRALKLPNTVQQYDSGRYRVGICWVYNGGWKLAQKVSTFNSNKWCDTTYALTGNTLWDGR